MQERVSLLSRFLVGVALTITSLSGCSVKEDRDACPCILFLHFPEGGKEWEKLVVFLNGDQFSVRDTVDLRQLDPKGYRRMVPRGQVHLLAAAPIGTAFSPIGRLPIPEGKDCPPVYMDARTLDTRSSVVRDTVHLYKNHCRLTMEFSYLDPIGFEQLEMSVTGGVDGYDERGQMTEGRFRYPLHPDEQGRCQVFLPRQMDESLALVMEKDGIVCQTFAIGEFMKEVGYDWSSPSLKDCRMSIDVAITSMVVEIGGWKKTYSYKFAI